MSKNESNPNQVKDRNWYNSIHEARVTAQQSIKNAAMIRNLGRRSQEMAHMKQAHSNTVNFFLELEPVIRNSEWEEDFLRETTLGHIVFPKLDQVYPVQGFDTYVALDNPVQVEEEGMKSGLLGTRDRSMTESQLIPLDIIIQAFRLLRLFAHNQNLTKSEQEENVHGEPF